MHGYAATEGPLRKVLPPKPALVAFADPNGIWPHVVEEGPIADAYRELGWIEIRPGP